MVYDARFHTVMEGYDDNDAVTNHIWDNLMGMKLVEENVILQAREEQNPLPSLHVDWLTETEE